MALPVVSSPSGASPGAGAVRMASKSANSASTRARPVSPGLRAAIQVLQRIAAGKSNKEIGAEFFISEGTVKTHVKSIFSKLDVVSRTEAVANASRRGLIQL